MKLDRAARNGLPNGTAIAANFKLPFSDINFFNDTSYTNALSVRDIYFVIFLFSDFILPYV